MYVIMILRPKATNSLSVPYQMFWHFATTNYGGQRSYSVTTELATALPHLCFVFITVIVRCDQRPQHYSSHRHSICDQMVPPWKY